MFAVAELREVKETGAVRLASLGDVCAQQALEDLGSKSARDAGVFQGLMRGDRVRRRPEKETTVRGYVRAVLARCEGVLASGFSCLLVRERAGSRLADVDERAPRI
jgi:hypothetical protein